MYFLTARVSALTIDARQKTQKTKTQQHTKQYTRVKTKARTRKKR